MPQLLVDRPATGRARFEHAPQSADHGERTPPPANEVRPQKQQHESYHGQSPNLVLIRWRGIAATLAYPIELKLAGQKIRLRSSEDFLRHADSILTPKVRSAILNQKYITLFANADGIMIGDGEVWFSGICKDAGCVDPPVKITAINP